MIDRGRRDILAQLLQQLADGEITNDEFEERTPHLKREDPAIRAVLSAAWFLYSDLRAHRLTGRHALSEKERAEVDRWIVFLKSDQEYMWPLKSLISYRNLIMNIFTLGLWRILGHGMQSRKLTRAGDMAVWPFVSQIDFEDAQNNPVKAHEPRTSGLNREDD